MYKTSIKKFNKGFTIVELLVLFVVLGILVLLAMPKFKDHMDKAKVARIRHDVKAAEGKVDEYLININNDFDNWEDKAIGELVISAIDDKIYDIKGPANTIETGEYKLLPKTIIKDIKTKLKGTFYANQGGKVYYEAINSISKGKDTSFTDEEIKDLIDEGYLPIANSEDLQNIKNKNERIWGKGTKWATEISLPGGLDKKYVQVKRINMKGIVLDPIGTSSHNFTGIYNGGKNTIINLIIDRPSSSYVGLFGFTSGAQIQNIGLSNVNIKGEDYTGGLVGRNDNNSIITNSYVKGNISGQKRTGGLIGRNNGGTIEDSYVSGKIIGGEEYTGGLIGLNSESTIINSYTTGTVEGGKRTGGLIGRNDTNSIIINSYSKSKVSGKDGRTGGLIGTNNDSEVTNSYATGLIAGIGNSTGGLIGDNSAGGKVKDSYATGRVSGIDYYTGGLVGRNSSGEIINSHATGDVSGIGSRTGGLAGENSQGGSIINSYATGNVRGERNATGGLSGRNDTNSTIINSYSTGKVIGEANTGGLVGSNRAKSEIINSYATGEVKSVGVELESEEIEGEDDEESNTGKISTGGLVGYNDSIIKGSYAKGEVTGTGSYTGGLAGRNSISGIVENSYALGDVSGNNYTGGLIGHNSTDSKIINTYAMGFAKGTGQARGLIGNLGPINVTKSYYNNINIGQPDSGLGGAQTKSAMKLQETYIDWDFINVWKIDEGKSYPRLRWQ
ncbi:MAG TPA: hypothetical protein GXZ90_03100 [Clostridiales bacterium]|nr:hypothetical protein [Clostridiales bacterium]